MTAEEILCELAELDGPRGKDAFFTLLHIERESLPVLEDAFRRSSSPGRRARIIEVVWQLRWPEALGLLLEAARDPAGPVWKEALNGLVAVPGVAGLDALKTLEREWSWSRADAAERLEWVREAIAQVEASAPLEDR